MPGDDVGGDVVVPAQLAADLARLAVIGARAIQRDSGGLVLVPGMAALLARLATFASETPARTVGCISAEWVSAGEAAAIAGLSVQRIRGLARDGRLIARRAGRNWLIDPDSIPRR